jgi:hypothetical protein
MPSEKQANQFAVKNRKEIEVRKGWGGVNDKHEEEMTR